MALNAELTDFDAEHTSILIGVVEITYSQNAIKFLHENNTENTLFTPLNGQLEISNVVNGRKYLIDHITYKEVP